MKNKSILSWLIPVLLSVFTFILLVVTNPDIGLTWDEPAYIAAAESYTGWFDQLFDNPAKAMKANMITQAWQVNSEHPPLDKVWSGAVWKITKTFTDDLTAHRMGNMLLAAIMLGLLFVWVRDVYGQTAGFVASAALLTMPRFFFHMHLSSLDVPATFAVFTTTFVFWKVKDKKHWAWGLFLALVWGLALATKVNAVFIPITLGLWWLIFSRKWKLFLRLVIMGLVAIPVFMACWPWLYQQTLERLGTYISFLTTTHWQIGQHYLGHFYMPPPWHFGFVVLWAVIPLSLSLLYFMGAIRNITGKKDGGFGMLFFISALTPVLIIAISGSLVYDDDRMYMAAFPFLAGLAGAGFSWLLGVWKNYSARWQKKAVFAVGAVLLIALAFVPQVITMINLYPHYLSYYGEGVGGVSGANKLGLETTYWCESYKLAVPILNRDAKPGDRVWVDPWSHDVLITYQTRGILRDDILIFTPNQTLSVLGNNAPVPRVYPMNQSDWFLFQHRQSTMGVEDEDNYMFKMVTSQKKIYEYLFDGVPIFTLYRNNNY